MVLPITLVLVGLVLFGAAHRALRRAGARIDTILDEELGHTGGSDDHHHP